MVLWIWIIILLAAFQIVVYTLSLDVTFLYASSLLILIAGVGVLYRIHTKQRVGKFEEQQRKLAKLEAQKQDL